MNQTKILFVCMGNICRSPTAEAVFRHKASEAGLDVHIDSAGTIAHHVGEQPDSRSRREGESRGYDFTGQRARQLQKSDFHDFDHLFAMDSDNLRDMLSLCPADMQHKVRLFLTMIDGQVRDVPDPYYGGARGFTEVLELVEQASEALVNELMVK